MAEILAEAARFCGVNFGSCNGFQVSGCVFCVVGFWAVFLDMVLSSSGIFWGGSGWLALAFASS